MKIVNKDVFRRRILDVIMLSALVVIVWMGFNNLEPLHFSHWKTIMVKQSQTLWGICRQDCPNAPTQQVVDAVCNENHIIGTIQPGEFIKVPTTFS